MRTKLVGMYLGWGIRQTVTWTLDCYILLSSFTHYWISLTAAIGYDLVRSSAFQVVTLRGECVTFLMPPVCLHMTRLHLPWNTSFSRLPSLLPTCPKNCRDFSLDTRFCGGNILPNCTNEMIRVIILYNLIRLLRKQTAWLWSLLEDHGQSTAYKYFFPRRGVSQWWSMTSLRYQLTCGRHAVRANYGCDTWSQGMRSGCWNDVTKTSNNLLPSQINKCWVVRVLVQKTMAGLQTKETVSCSTEEEVEIFYFLNW